MEELGAEVRKVGHAEDGQRFDDAHVRGGARDERRQQAADDADGQAAEADRQQRRAAQGVLTARHVLHRGQRHHHRVEHHRDGVCVGAATQRTRGMSWPVVPKHGRVPKQDTGNKNNNNNNNNNNNSRRAGAQSISRDSAVAHSRAIRPPWHRSGFLTTHR